MKEMIAPECRKNIEDIWCSWPAAKAVSLVLAAHAKDCPVCRKELSDLEAFCARCSDSQNRPLSWETVLPDSYWAKSRAAIQGALPQKSFAPTWLRWAPALALAAAGAIFLFKPAPPPVLDVPVEAVEQHELLEHLELLENWDQIQTVALPENRRHD